MRDQNLWKAIFESGWTALDARTHPRAYVDTGGKRYGTLEKDGVRIALSLNQCLCVERGVAMVYQSDQDQQEAILQALIVDADYRRRGRAREALEQVAQLADSCMTDIYLEPCPIEDKPVTREGLVALYRDYGFNDIQGKNVAMVRPARLPSTNPRTYPS